MDDIVIPYEEYKKQSRACLKKLPNASMFSKSWLPVYDVFHVDDSVFGESEVQKYFVAELIEDVDAVNHGSILDGFQKWLRQRDTWQSTSRLERPSIQKERSLDQMCENALVSQGRQIVDLALMTRDNLVAVMFEVESSHDTPSTIKKLSCGLLSQLLYLRNRSVNTQEVVGFFIPVGEAGIEKVTCTWSDDRLAFGVTRQRLQLQDVARTIVQVYTTQLKYKPETATKGFLIPMTSTFIESNFGRTAHQLLSGASIVIYSPDRNCVYKYSFEKMRRMSELFSMQVDIRHSSFPLATVMIEGMWYWKFEAFIPPMSTEEAKNNLETLVTGTITALKELHDVNIAHLDVRLPNICRRHGTRELVLIDLDRSCDNADRNFNLFQFGRSTMYSKGTSTPWTPLNSDWRQVAILITYLQKTNVENYHEIQVDDSSHQFLKMLFNEGKCDDGLFEEWKRTCLTVHI